MIVVARRRVSIAIATLAFAAGALSAHAQDVQAPLLSINNPIDGDYTNSAVLTVSGTASDSGQGDSGIASVTVNGASATGGTAAGSDTASWSYDLPLVTGTNHIAVVATDGSAGANQSSQSVDVAYAPLIEDAEPNGLADVWQVATGQTDPDLDAEPDGYTNLEEYRAGTNPNSAASHPEGAGGVNYVLFRDTFDDSQWEDRWQLGGLDVNAAYTLIENGSELTATLVRPASACKGVFPESFAMVAGTELVYHARLRLLGYGQTTLGIVRDVSAGNRLEVILDADQSPYVRVDSADAGVLTSTEGTSGPYQGQTVDVRIVKNGALYTVFVNHVQVASVTNNGIGNATLRPFAGITSCADDTGSLDTRFDVIELLVDRDADGRADTREDGNANGSVDAGESNPLAADTDNDTIADGFDNCVLHVNANQRDANGEGYGNRCDADLNNNGIVNSLDLGLFKADYLTTDADSDLNGDGIVNSLDLGIFKALYLKAPGPSGLIW